MKKSIVSFILVFILSLVYSCGEKKPNITREEGWKNFSYPHINFVNKASRTAGWDIYNNVIPNPEKYITETIQEVVKTLYWTENDSIPNVKKINYYFEDIDEISSKAGAPPEISISYSSRWVEKSDKKGGEKEVLFETRGVLLHELTHGFQLEPQGIGNYGTNRTFFAFIEGMADAVRIHNGGFQSQNKKPGGNWMDGYQTTGYFLEWLTGKDADFLRKFNKSTLNIIPWNFDDAIKYALGDEYSVESLWEEYQASFNN